LAYQGASVNGDSKCQNRCPFASARAWLRPDICARLPRIRKTDEVDWKPRFGRRHIFVLFKCGASIPHPAPKPRPEVAGVHKAASAVAYVLRNYVVTVGAKTGEGAKLSNIATALKAEIVRLARKELRGATAKLKKASARYRLDIAALKRRIASLEKNASARSAKPGVAPAGGDADTRVRYSAKGIAAQRRRLELSAAQMGALVGVSAQTIYHWESGKSRPRRQQMAGILAVRSLGKREAVARLKRQAK